MKKENRLTFIKFVENKGKYKQALFLCSCGNKKEIRHSRVLSNDTKSCGCLSRETCKKRASTHGLSKSIEYVSWRAMKRRCLVKTDKDYRRYGAKGITICDQWLDSFESSLSDMGERPNIKYSLDRKDTYGNYEPDNCRWATDKQQSNNRTNNKFLTYKGFKNTYSEWERLLNYRKGTISDRLRNGWSAEKIINTPVRKVKKCQ